MKTKDDIVADWLPRYTGRSLDSFGQFILLSNFVHYVDLGQVVALASLEIVGIVRIGISRHQGQIPAILRGRTTTIAGVRPTDGGIGDGAEILRASGTAYTRRSSRCVAAENRLLLQLAGSGQGGSAG